MGSDLRRIEGKRGREEGSGEKMRRRRCSIKIAANLGDFREIHRRWRRRGTHPPPLLDKKTTKFPK